MRPAARFALGLAAGFVLATAALQLAGDLELAALLDGRRESTAPDTAPTSRLIPGAWTIIERNLRGSVVPFLLILLCYLHQLSALRGILAQPQPAVAQVLRREQLLDLCANLCFGIGVIWTAIGMRGALLYALGDTGDVATGSGQAVLQRLVDGGILLALSTTIVGGIGGYLMRSGKYLLCGEALSALYLSESRRSARQGLDALQRIESALTGQGTTAANTQRRP